MTTKTKHYISTCCNAELYENINTPLCSWCMEHCEKKIETQ